MGLGPGVSVDAEELGEEKIGRPVVGDDLHEREIRHVLHGGQGGQPPPGLVLSR